MRKTWLTWLTGVGPSCISLGTPTRRKRRVRPDYRGQYGDGGFRLGSAISKRRAGVGSRATMRTSR